MIRYNIWHCAYTSPDELFELTLCCTLYPSSSWHFHANCKLRVLVLPLPLKVDENGLGILSLVDASLPSLSPSWWCITCLLGSLWRFAALPRVTLCPMTFALSQMHCVHRWKCVSSITDRRFLFFKKRDLFDGVTTVMRLFCSIIWSTFTLFMSGKLIFSSSFF